MKLNTFSKQEIKRGDGKSRKLISILSSVETSLFENVKNKYDKILELRFDDIPIPIEDYIIFNKEHLKEIKEFVKEDEDIDIHCSAGISRSTAVAIGICILKGNIDMMLDYLDRHHLIIPNDYILSMFRLELTKDNYDDRFHLYNIYKIIQENRKKSLTKSPAYDIINNIAEQINA